MTSARSHFYRFAPVVVLLLVAAVVYLNPAFTPRESTPLPLECADLRAGCAGQVDGREVRLGVQGELKVLQPFELWVRAEGAQRVEASFAMEGMDMGFNLYTLRADKEGIHRARVTLPVCVTGRRDWVMTLDVDGRRLSVPFVTEL